VPVSRQRNVRYQQDDPADSHAPARVRAVRGPLQAGRYVLVGSGGGFRAMPGPAVGISLGIGHLGERPVNEAAIIAGRGVVDRRADERVAECHPLAEPDQVCGLCFVGGLFAEAEAAGGRPQQIRVTQGLGGSQQEQQASLV